MKKTVLLSSFILFCCVLGAAGRSIKVSGPVQKITEVEVLKASEGTVADYAANELRRCLRLATGKEIPLVKKATPGKYTIVVGDGELARKAGVDVGKLPEEGFYIRRMGNMLFIAGQDDLPFR